MRRVAARCLTGACLAALAAAPSVWAQDDAPPERPRLPTRAAVADTRGLSLVLTSSGLGGGVARSEHVGGAVSFVTEASIGGIRDERETKYAGLGGTAIQAKRTFLVALPLRAGVAVRLFEHSIAPNVRPFVLAAAGPTPGWAYPYFLDCNANGNLDADVDCNADGTVDAGEGERTLGFFEAQGRGRLLLGVGAVAGVGAHVGWGRRVTGLRLAYRIDAFPTGVALLEARVRGRQRVFASPEVSLTFGRLR